jgi:hypothetical protein
VTVLQVGKSGVRIIGRDTRFFSSANRPERVAVPLSTAAEA